MGTLGISRGVLDMALGALCMSLMSLFVKLVGQRLPSQEVVFVRGLLTLLFSLFLLRRAGVPALGSRSWLLVLRGFLGFAALSCFYYALVHLPLAEATVLQYINPLFAAVFGIWFLSEHMGVREVGLVLGSLAGVLIIARPEFLMGGAASDLDPVAVGLGVLGAVLSGAAYVLVRHLSRTEHPLVIVLYFPLITVPAALPGALVDPVIPTPTEWLLLLGMGAFAQLGQILITRGLSSERAGKATAIGYLQVVFAAVWGFLVFREMPDLWTITGSLIILGCTLGLALHRPVKTPDDGTLPIRV